LTTPLSKSLRLFAAMLLLGGIAQLPAQTHKPAAGPASGPATREKIIRYVRGRFNVPEAVTLDVSEFRNSPFPDFYETTLTVDDGKGKHSQKLFVSKDGRYLVEGNIFTLGADPRREIVRSISLEDQPGHGPANAPVTIVEYSDLQCPSCAGFHELLVKEVVRKYGDKVRVVFKEFPLVTIHDWALSAALANQCVYQIDPAAYVPFRSLVFQNQNSLNAANARDSLLNYGEQAGVDRVKLASCLDAKASLPRVEESAREGQVLGIASTPTSFVNGRVVVGSPEPAEFFKIVDEALRAAR
jgi:protein-disulfide isomerase